MHYWLEPKSGVHVHVHVFCYLSLLVSITQSLIWDCVNSSVVCRHYLHMWLLLVIAHDGFKVCAIKKHLSNTSWASVAGGILMYTNILFEIDSKDDLFLMDSPSAYFLEKLKNICCFFVGWLCIEPPDLLSIHLIKTRLHVWVTFQSIVRSIQRFP